MAADISRRTKRTEAREESERPQQMHAARHVAEGGIAAEAFIGAQSAQRHLDAGLMCRLGDEPGVDAIDGRQIHGVEDRRQVALELGAIDGAHDVAGAVARGDLRRQRRLVERRAAELLEGQRHGKRVARAKLGHGAEQRARIESRRQEHGDRNVGHEMMAHRVVHGGAQRRARLGDVLYSSRPLAERTGDAVVLAWRMRAGRVDDHGGASRHGADALPDGEGLGHAAQQMEADDARGIGIARYGATGQQRLGLRGEAQGPAIVGIVERLDAERIAGQQEPALPRIPQAEGEHAAQRLDHGRAALLVELQHHLGVGVGTEATALGFELGLELAVIVDLAVEGDGERAVGAVHRLRAALGKIDDGEPPVGEADPAVGRQPVAAAVGAARRHAGVHAPELGAIDRRGDVEVGGDAGYSTHGRRTIAGVLDLARASAAKEHGEGPQHDDEIEPQASSASGRRDHTPISNAFRRASWA